MGGRSIGIRLVVLAATLTPVLPAQQGQPPAPRQLPARIDVIGASVSAGYVDFRRDEDGARNDTVPLLRALRHVWPGDLATVGSRADMGMFRDPMASGERQVLRTLRRRPDLVVAIDFLFWFGYGSDRPDARGRARRIELQRRGLELLDRLPCPIIVGDYPDMDGADARVMHPRMVPELETLDELNRRLRAWAAERPRVRVFPLAQWVAELKRDGLPLPMKDGPLQTPPFYLLQSDKLHATRLGVALLAYRLQALARELLPDGHPLGTRRVTFEFLVEAVGAQPDLEGISR